MNIQIFGTKKNADTRKAERFFKERGIKFQSVDLKEKGSKRRRIRERGFVVRTAAGLRGSQYGSLIGVSLLGAAKGSGTGS